MLGEGECEILRKLLELVHHTILKTGAKDKMTTTSEAGDGHGVAETRGISRIVQETQILDMYTMCFGVRTNMLMKFIQCGITGVE